MLAQPVAEGAPGHVLHDDGDRAVVDLLDRFGTDDVRMVEVGNRPSFAREALQCVRVVEIPSPDRLDGNDLPACPLSREVNGRDPPMSELPDELVLVFQGSEIGGKVGFG